MAMERFVVSRDDSVYEAFPDLVQTVSGKLVCVFTECAHHLDRTGARIMITESADRGRTWSPKRPFTEKGTREDNFNCARISRLRDGTLAVVCDRIYGGEVRGRSELWVWFGDAEGTEWSEPTVYPFCGIVPDKYLELENGRRILAAHFTSRETGKLEQYLWYSDDGGNTWSDRVTVAADPELNPCEISILDCGGGTLVGFLRENSGKGIDILKTISRDWGETWSPMCHTPICAGHRPVAGFLRDGSVMVTYRYIPLVSECFFASFLRKGDLLETAREKQYLRTMPLEYDRNPSPDNGYSGWTQFDDGEICVVTYIKDDADKAYIRGCRFRPEDVVFPRTEHTSPQVFWPEE